MAKPRVGISACLLGRNTRYDGRAKGAPELVAALAPDVEWVPLCPEADAGLGVPRPPMDLYRQAGGRIAAITPEGHDCTPQLDAWIAATLPALRHGGLDGAILKARSPSCAIGTARLHDGAPGQDGNSSPDTHGAGDGASASAVGTAPVGVSASAEVCDGLFAAALKRAMPELPLAEDEDLRSAAQREQFLARLRVHQRLRRDRRRLLVILALLLALLALMLSSPTLSRYLPPCPLHYLSHGRLTCPGCGFTRGWQALLAGDWRGAGVYHPFAFRILPLLVMVAAGHALLCRLQRRRWPLSSWLWTAFGAWIAAWLLTLLV
ncbi:MAG: 2-thiouracil desulfurase family protein [Lentisphaeria bacterium]|nr:2-thiouracil desulfurase family protein [Lentisphaeria bacterium]